MNPVHDYDSLDHSCSCMSCLYKSESDRPSLRKFIAHGSRIDKLYYGKYLPLRERKLLERLCRTRTLYDDLRKQIVSDSSVSLDKQNLIRRSRKLTKNNKIKRSSDIITLVDLVDKGAVLSLENLNKCCSCCICGSNTSTNETPKRRFHKHKHEQEWSHKYNHGYSRVRKRISKIIATSKHKLGQMSELRKNVQFRPKNIRSEPCTCTYKFSGIQKRASSRVTKRMHHKRPESELEPMSGTEQYETKRHNGRKVIKQSFQKVKHSDTCLCNKIEEGTKRSESKLKKSATKLKGDFKYVAKRSIEGLKHAKYKTKDKVEPPKRKVESLESNDAKKVERSAFKIRKDSLTKFREKLRYQRENNDWKCDFECYPDECVPEQCFKILKRERIRNKLQKRLQHEPSKLEKKVGELSDISGISKQVQFHKIENATKGVKKKPEFNNTHIDKKSGSVAPGVNLDIKKKVNTDKESLKSGINKTTEATRTEFASPVPQTKSIQSMTSLSKARSRLLAPSMSSGDVSRTVTAEPNKNVNIIKEQHMMKNKTHEVKLAKVETPFDKTRQAVRVGSSFSFNIEFYKDKPAEKLPEVNNTEVMQINKPKIPTKKKENTINSKEDYHKFRRIRHHHKMSGTLQPTAKNTQAGGHPLKRCFCTLKLKAKKTKIYVNGLQKQQSVQTKNLHSADHNLLPYECEPYICKPGKCNPINCEKIIRKGNIKHRYLSTNNNYKTKSIASKPSKSISSATSRGIQVHSTNKTEKIMLSKAPAAVNGTDSYPKQAVRIGSTFSFNIEFSKQSPLVRHRNINVDSSTLVKETYERTKREKRVNKAKPYIRHKYSQISNSTEKSRHTLTKYNLRRCFCTLKLGSPEKKNRISSISKSTVTSYKNIDRAPKLHPTLEMASVGTMKQTINPKKIKLRLLPYECEPNVCIPGECDPYKCQKFMYARQPKYLKDHTRKSNTERRKTRSTSSLTSSPVKLTKTKKVQSAFVAYERKLPSYVPKNTVSASQLVNKSHPNQPTKQAVRIGSSFNFNIEFYKEKPTDVISVFTPQPNQVTPIINIRQPPKTTQSPNKIFSKDHGFQEIEQKRRSKQMQMEKKQRSIQIGTAIKRCFCTLKLHKKDARLKEVSDIGTKTSQLKIKTQLHASTVSQNTMTKKNYKYIPHLEPLECEPYVCVPVKCNPYECLERIKRRDLRRYSREVGVITKPRNLRSSSSFVQNGVLPTRDVFIQSNIVEQMEKKTPIQIKLSPRLDLSDKSRNINVKKPRQVVNIGSKFSFDIEFYKNLPQEHLKIIQNKIKERGDTNIRTSINRGYQPFQVPVSYNESQATINKMHKSTGAALLKKCFCTLKLRKKHKKYKEKYRVSSPVKQTIQPLKVYTVSRITTGSNKFIQQPTLTKFKKNEKWDLKGFTVKNHSQSRITNMYRFDNEILQDTENSVQKIAPSLVQIMSGQLFRNFKVNNYSLINVQSSTHLPYRNKSKQSIRLNYAYRMKQSTKFPKTTNILKTTHIDTSTSICDEIYPKHLLIKASEDIITEKHHADVKPFSKSFFAMNIQIAGRPKTVMPKLEPYECEPGVCTPYECDTDKCQELINKRLLKTMCTSSSIERNLKSTSSLTSEPSSIATKARKSSKGKESNKKLLPSNLEYKAIFPNRKQAVRVGSNFSFNLEFCKSKSDGEKPKYTPSKKNHKSDKKLKPKGFQIQQEMLQRKSKQTRAITSIHDKESQSAYMKMGHKETDAIPLPKKCFCTLKLKKRRDEKLIASTATQAFISPVLKNDIIKLKTMDSAQNTKTLKSDKKIYDIKPYECEPGVCVSGQCDPYQCLDLLKKRKQKTKNYGTESMRSTNISNSSMTSRKKKNYRRIQMKSPDSRYYRKPSESTSRSSNQFKELSSDTKPERQAVRIGSNFSFNVELFKEHSATTQNVYGKLKKGSISRFSEKKSKGIQEREKYPKKYKESFSQNQKSAHNINSQIDIERNVKSTMTNSFLKRCFCVAKLRGEQKLKSSLQKKKVDVEGKLQHRNTPSFLERCFCALRSITTVKEISKNVPNVQPVVLSQTLGGGRQFKRQPRKLEPYECEPGICTPGLCDPFECNQVIKNRKSIGVTKVTNTVNHRTKSAFSSIRTSRKVKDGRTQLNSQKVSKQQGYPPSSAIGLNNNSHKKQVLEKTNYRQAVKIGSNFSFDIDFYKNKLIRNTVKQKSLLKTNSMYKKGDWKTNDKIKKTRNRGTSGSESFVHNQDAQTQALNRNSRASGVSHLLQRCFCTLGLQKKKLRKRSSVLASQNNEALIVKRTPDVRDISVMTLGRAIPYKLEPYECEPNICIPGECNSYECEKRIKKRLRRESATLAGIYKTKTGSSLASTKSLKNKNIKVQSQLKSDKEIKTKRFRNSTDKEINKTGKQAVNIGSSFSFNIEFFKDKSHNATMKISKLPKKLYNNAKNDIFDKKPPSILYKHKKTQGTKQMQNIDSQVPKSVRSTMTGVTPFLKRCFCTLKIQKRKTKLPLITRNTIAVGPDTREIIDARPKKDIYNKTVHSSDKDVTYAAFMNLEPYECEPGVCIPGECNPHECKKIINMRKNRKTTRSSSTQRPKGFSKYSSAGTGSKVKKSQAFSVERKKHEKLLKKRLSGFVSQPSNQCQAVRVGSTFSFNIEVNKDRNSPRFHDVSKDRKLLVKNKKYSETISKLKTKDMTIGNKGINFRHRQSQVNRIRTESRGSGVGPLLKRCFCTLKFQKLGTYSKRQTSTIKITKPILKSMYTETEAIAQPRDINPINNRLQALESYECEPGICTSGFCDPYKCEVRINKRQMRELGTVTQRPTLKCASILTSRNMKTKSIKAQQQMKKKGDRKKVSEKKSKKCSPSIIPSPVEVTDRQAVRVGSSFGFNIEFYKHESPKHTRSLPSPQTVKNNYLKNSRKSKNAYATSNRLQPSKTHGSQGRHSSYERGSQVTVIYTKSRGSGMTTKLKRCFCKLALQNFSGIPVPNNEFNTISKPKIYKPIEGVSTQTKIRPNKIKGLSYPLEPSECEPGLCIPGECNPNECIKIMKRNARRYSRTAGTQRKQPSQISTSSMTSASFPKSKTVQSGSKYIKKHTLNPKQEGKGLIKEPSFSLVPNVKSRQAVKIGSKFSFDIELYKDSVPQKVFIDTKYKSTQKRMNSKDTKCTNATCKIINSRSRKSQSQLLKSEDKASLVDNILKRCFFTTKLHKKPSIPHPKVTTINRVDDHTIIHGLKPQQYQVYYQFHKSVKNNCPKRCMCTKCDNDFHKLTNTVGTKTKNKYIKFKLNQCIQRKGRYVTNDTKTKALEEMETILPYTPNKFNKKASKAILINNETKKSFLLKCHPTCICNNRLNQNHSQRAELNKLNDAKRSKGLNKLTNKETKSLLLKDTFTKTSKSTASPIKDVVCRCKEIFLKHTYKTGKTNSLIDNDQMKSISVKPKELTRSGYRDKLKTSKSERCRADKNQKEPTQQIKKSKSLKIPNISDKNDSQIVKQQRNKKYSQCQQGDTNKNKIVTPVLKLHMTGDSNEYKKYICLHCQNKYGHKEAKFDKLNSLANINKIYKPTNKTKQEKKTVKFSGIKSKGVEYEVQKKDILSCFMNIHENEQIIQPTKLKKENSKGKDDSPPRKRNKKLLGREEYCPYCYLSEIGIDNESKDKSEICNKEIKDMRKKGKPKSKSPGMIEKDDKTLPNNKKPKGTAKQYKLKKTIDGGKIVKGKLITDSAQIKGKGKSLGGGKQNKSKVSMKAPIGLKLHEVGKQIKSKSPQVFKGKQTFKGKHSRFKSGAKVCECRALIEKSKESKRLAKKMKGKTCKCYPSVCECAKMVKMEKEKKKKIKAFFKKQLKKTKNEKKRRLRIEKQRKGAGKRRRRNFFLRQKKYQIEDALRLHKRRDIDHYLEHRLRLKDTPDYLVATESVLDLAKLSCTVMEDIARSTYRAIVDPRYTYQRVEATVKKPSRIWPIVKTAVINSGATATFKRIIHRCKTMSSVKKIRTKLEQNRCTHYLLHIADRDPRKRLKSKKAHERLKRQRVPLDFQCSLYMASLRKKPCLKVYFKCPWFYPHFVNLLGVLKQLSDIFLFILAAIVWSPCILCMELCRGMMCCLLCTG